MSTGRETFHKSERLCSQKIISALFENGNIIYSSLFKLVWLIGPPDLPFPVQAAFSVSKKSFRKAVIRNLIRRRMRESYRKIKSNLYTLLETEHIRLTFVIIFRGNTVADFPTIDKAMKEMLDKLSSQIRENRQKS